MSVDCDERNRENKCLQCLQNVYIYFFEPAKIIILLKTAKSYFESILMGCPMNFNGYSMACLEISGFIYILLITETVNFC